MHIAYNFEHNIAFLIEIIDQYTLFLIPVLLALWSVTLSFFFSESDRVALWHWQCHCGVDAYRFVYRDSFHTTTPLAEACPARSPLVTGQRAAGLRPLGEWWEMCKDLVCHVDMNSIGFV